ncbi:MFS transporter [Streptomyces sp. HNA39]|uniref:MFS transporter n=1 Tax=Streptomyces sp. HNA39 TaxID=2850561 RepID=UPI00200C8E34|nr:MFS transporter [Streptomyces sp. HNA39]
MLVAGLTVFGAASVLAGLAPTAEIMLGARVLSGAGAAMMMPITLAVITSTFPEEERGRAIGGGRPARCAAVGRLPPCRGRPAGRHPRGRGGHRARVSPTRSRRQAARDRTARRSWTPPSGPSSTAGSRPCGRGAP